MHVEHYRLTDDLSLANRWFLNGVHAPGHDVDGRVFTCGVAAPAIPGLMVGVRVSGTGPDFTLADFDVPVVSLRLAEALQRLAGVDIQRVPVIVESTTQPHEILNVVAKCDAIDAERSDILYWQSGDNRPDRLGLPRMVTKLKVDRDRAGTHRVFRLEGWLIVIVVSRDIKLALEHGGFSGLSFAPL